MSNQESSAKGKGRWAIIAVIVVLVLALGICIFLLISRSGEGEPQTSDAVPEAPETSQTVLDRGFVDESNMDNIMSDMSEKVEDGMFECMMSSTWIFEDATSESSNSYVANVESNRHALYFDVYEEQTNDLLYSSPILPVGSEIRNIKLDKELPVGDYDAVVMYTLVNEAYEEVSTVGFNITISIKN